MANQGVLENIWRSWEPTKDPHVHPDDAAIIERFNRGAKPDIALQTQLLPEPFIGDLNNCCLLILAHNPGYAAGYDHEVKDDDFRSAAVCNLRQEPQPYPFFLLNPRFDSFSGGRWWRAAFRQLIDAVSIRSRVPVDHALQRVARG